MIPHGLSALLILPLVPIMTPNGNSRQLKSSPSIPTLLANRRLASCPMPAAKSPRASGWLRMDHAPSGKHVVVQTDANATDSRFPVLIADSGEYADLDVSMKAKAISGKVDQGMGLVFRFRDPKSYYVVRANALENNFRLYKMVNGKRLQFAGANMRVSTGQWHAIRVVAKGDRITCWLDGEQLINARDKTYTTGNTGKVGLWTKADSVTAFDDLTVSQ